MKRINQAMQGVLSALLALLGFGSCDKIGADEYGSPYLEYQVKGQVTDESGKPIEGIRVTIENETYGFSVNHDGVWKYSFADTVYTDADGRFVSREINDGSIYGKIFFEDIDGPANGSFLPDSANLEDLEQKQIEDEDGWYNGKFEVNVQQELEREEDKAGITARR